VSSTQQSATESSGERVPRPVAPSTPPKSQCVCVLGMHRSGTSLTARILNLIGVDLGPEERMLPGLAHDNPTGFWEQERITALNEHIFGAFGTDWWRPPPMLPGWEKAPELEPLRDEARRVLSELFARDGLWGFKDPRLSLTLPFWRALIPEMWCVVCLRNPLDVAASLKARDPNTFPLGDSIDLWLRYTAAALELTASDRRTLLFYEDWFDQPAAEVSRLARFLCRDPDAVPKQVRAEIESFVDDELRHHATPPEDLAATASVAPEVTGAYLMLKAAVKGCDSDNSAAQTVRETAEAFVPLLWKGLEDRQRRGRRVHILEEERVEVMRRLAKAEREAGESAVKARDVALRLEEAETARARALGAAARAEEGQVELERRVEELESVVEHVRAWAIGLDRSLSFRITAPLRWLKRVVGRIF
jgi:hypothetical protein